MDQQWTNLQTALVEAYEGFRLVALRLVQQIDSNPSADSQTAKGVIAHLADWDQEATQRFEAIIGFST